MKNTELLQEIRRQVAVLRQAGSAFVDIASLDRYLAEMEELASREPNGLDALKIEQNRAELQIRLAEHSQREQSRLEGFKATIAAGQAALRAAILVNGGAAAALLAFIGHVATAPTGRFEAGAGAPALLCFVGGVLAAAMAAGSTYLAQAYFQHNREKPAQVWNNISIGLVCLSYLLFFAGAISGVSVLANPTASRSRVEGFSEMAHPSAQVIIALWSARAGRSS